MAEENIPGFGSSVPLADADADINHCPSAEILQEQLQKEEVKVNGEDKHDPKQHDDTEPANNVIMKGKSQVVGDDLTATDSVENTREGSRVSTPPQQPNRKSPTLDESTQVPSGNPEKQSRSQPRPDFRPLERPKSTSSCSRGNSVGRSGFYNGGFRRFYWILLFLGFFSCATSQPIGTKETKLDESFNSAQFQIENLHLWRAKRTANGVDFQLDSLVHVFGESLNLICSINNSIANKTDAWNRRIGKSNTELIYFGTTLINSTKFETIDDGSTLVIKNLNEEDIGDYCYYCRIDITPSKCKNILDENNTVVLPSRTAVTFPMNKTIRLQSGCYPNLTFFMIIQDSVVANQTATKKDNGLYEVDMIYNYKLKKGEQFLVVARLGNKSYIVYNSTDDQIIKHEEDSSGISNVVSIPVLVAAVISSIVYNKWR